MRDFNKYYKRMESNLKEKLDFIWPHLLELDVVIDFGCANGATTEVMASMFPDSLFIGIDIESVISVNKKYNDHIPNINYMTIENYKGYDPAEFEGKKVGVIFSSVTHELFSETILPAKTKTKELIDSVLKEMFIFDADIIFIRDMYCPYTFDIEGDLYQKQKDYLVKDEREFLSLLLVEFYQKFGLKTNRDLVHYLLKSRYPKNFGEEMKEDYFSTEWEQIEYYSKDLGYKKIFDLGYMNNYLKTSIFETQSIDIGKYTPTTHRKMILSRI